MRTSPRPRDNDKRPDVAGNVVQSRKHLVHEVEIDLAQAQGIHASKLGINGRDKGWFVRRRRSRSQVLKRRLRHPHTSVQITILWQQFFAVATPVDCSL